MVSYLTFFDLATTVLGLATVFDPFAETVCLTDPVEFLAAVVFFTTFLGTFLATFLGTFLATFLATFFAAFLETFLTDDLAAVVIPSAFFAFRAAFLAETFSARLSLSFSPGETLKLPDPVLPA